MTPDKHLLYNIHKYMLQSLPSLPAMPAFPTAAFHPSLLQTACMNLPSRTELEISRCCSCVFSLPGKQRVLCTGAGVPGGTDTGIVMLPVGRWLSTRASWSKQSHREARYMLRSRHCSARQTQETREEREGNFPSPVLSPATLVIASHPLLPRAHLCTLAMP